MSYGVTFRGNENVNSRIANYNRVQNCPPENPNCGQVNFRANQPDYDYYEGSDKKKKGWKIFGAVAGTLAGVALIIGGMGLAHKKIDPSKLEKDWAKKTYEFFEPATKKCHEWCSWVKDKGVKAWDWIKGLVGKGDKKPETPAA